VDEKGRIKLPTAIHKFINDLGDQTVFITSLDGHTIRIYPISLWIQNEKLFNDIGPDAEGAAYTQFLANEYGLESAIDTQGRALIKQNLREKLALAGKTLSITYIREVFEAYSPEEYQARLQRALQDPEARLRNLMQKGLK
jgi:MraZ protein